MPSTPSTPKQKGKRSTRQTNTPGDASVVSRSSTGSLKPGVAWNIQKQLAQELERAFPLAFCPDEGNSVTALIDTSGTQALSRFLDNLVNEDPDNAPLFGTRGSQERGKIGDLIQQWKKNKKEDYRRKVVIRLGVITEKARKPRRSIQPAKTLQHQAVNVSSEEGDSEPSEISFEQVVLEEDDNKKQDSNRPQAMSFRKKQPASTSNNDPIIGSTVSSKKAKKNTEMARFTVLEDGTVQEWIEVDIKNPELMPTPFKIKTADRLKGVDKGKTFQGYILEMRVHPCDAIGHGDHPPFEFKAKLDDTQTVTIEGPVLDYTDKGGDDDEVRDYLLEDADPEDMDSQGDPKMNEEDEVMMEAFDNARNNLEERIENEVLAPKKEWKLMFPSDVHLSKAVLDVHKPYKESDRLHMRALPIEYELLNAAVNPNDLSWEDVEKHTVAMHDDQGKEVQQDVFFYAQPTVSVMRFAIYFADLNKDSRLGKKIIKAADTMGTTAMMAAMGRKKKKKKGTSVASANSSDGGSLPASPVGQTTTTDTLTAEEIHTRVSGACAIVAAEANLTTEVIMDYIQVPELFAFTVKNNIDLVYAVKETYKRASAIAHNLDILASEPGTKYNRSDLNGLLNWFDVYQFAVQNNRDDLVAVMKEAIAWIEQGQPAPAQQATNTNRAKKGPKELSERELERAKKFKSMPDGRTQRQTQRGEKGAQKRASLLTRMRIGYGGK